MLALSLLTLGGAGGAVPTAGASTRGATLHLDEFLSPGGKVWCAISEEERYVFCGNMPLRGLAEIHGDDAATICAAGCIQNWNDGAPVLGYGQQTEVNGFRCASERKGVTCTALATGSGFLIGEAGAVQVTATSPIDPCLVGTWKEISESDLTSFNGSVFPIRGNAGRILTFSPTGRELVDYRHAAPLRGKLNGAAFVEQFHGLVTYRDHSSGQTLSFTHGDFSKFWVTGTYGGSPLRFSRSFRNSPPVKFTCSATRHTQSTTGYSARFVRVG